MAENLMNSAHKASTPESRANWDRIFREPETDPEQELIEIISGQTVKTDKPCRCNPGDCD